MNKYYNAGAASTTSAPWFSSIYKASIYAASILTLIYWTTTEQTSFGALAAALFTFALGLLMILILTINNIQKTTNSLYGILSQVIKQSGPILLVVGFIGYFLYLIFTYRNSITNAHVAPTYYTFTNLTISLIFIQILILLQYQTTDGYIFMTNITSSILYLINVLLFICVTTVSNTLRFFTTDGFHTR